MSLTAFLNTNGGVQSVANATPLPVGVAPPTATTTAAYESSATFTPTAATAYDANDVVDVAKEFTGVGPTSGGKVFLVGTVIEIRASALISGETSYNLQLYNVTPPSAHADAATWDLPTGDLDAHIATIPLGTPVDLGSTLKLEVDSINKLLTVPAGGSLYGELVTVGAFTGAAVVRKVTLKTVGV